MNWFNEFIAEHGWFTIISSTLGIGGTIFAVVIYFREKKEKNPVFYSRSISVVNPSLAKLKNIEVTYLKVPIDYLTLVKFSFWNAGKMSILKSDIAPKDPILFKVPVPVIIYDVEIIFQNLSNNFILTKIDDNTVKIDFDYIDYNEGFVFKVFHSGNTKTQITMQGTIIGSSKLKWAIRTNEEGAAIQPSTYLIAKKNIFAKILGCILLLPSFPIYIAYNLLTLPKQFFNMRLDKLHREEFLLKDDNYY
jgi:hypothetical protein